MVTALCWIKSSFHGTGVPLQVLLHGFKDKKAIWFTITYGQYNDNILLIGLDECKANILPKVKHNGVSPIDKAFGTTGKFEEYSLCNEVQTALGINLDSENLSIDKEKVLYQIFIHDDCFFSIELVDRLLLQELIHCILQQHSFYLNSEVDWSDVLDPITKEVSKSKPLLLKSMPARKCVIVRPEGFFQSIKGLLLPSSLCAISINNSKATLSKAYRKKMNS
jgi:hypothetical protein